MTALEPSDRLDVPYYKLDDSFRSRAGTLDAFGHLELRHMIIDDMMAAFAAPRRDIPSAWNMTPVLRFVWLVAWLNDIPIGPAPAGTGSSAPWVQIGLQTHKLEDPAAKDFCWWLNRQP